MNQGTRAAERRREALRKAIEQVPVPPPGSVVDPHEYWTRHVVSIALVLLGVREEKATGLAGDFRGTPPGPRLEKILRRMQ